MSLFWCGAPTRQGRECKCGFRLHSQGRQGRGCKCGFVGFEGDGSLGIAGDGDSRSRSVLRGFEGCEDGSLSDLRETLGEGDGLGRRGTKAGVVREENYALTRALEGTRRGFEMVYLSL